MVKLDMDNNQIRGAVERSGFIRGVTGHFYYVLVLVCAVFSLITSADAARQNGVAEAESHTKALNNKLVTSCDTLDSSQNKSHSLNKSCLVPLSTIDKLRTQKDFNFVDVRSPAEYDRYHITGSINIPLYLIKTKEFLKKLPVVFVNDGRSTTELEKTCVELKQAGFNRVSVLEGGLFAWRANKRSLEGDPVEQAKLNRMAADELIEERNKPNLYVIDMSTSGKHKDLITWLPAKIISVSINSKGDLSTRISSIILQQLKLNPQARPLLIADDNEVYTRIDARLQKSGIATGMLRLDGGIKGYREQVTRQIALWSEQNKPRRYEACRG